MAGVGLQARSTAVTRTTCPYCGVGCGVLASVEDGKLKIEGDPEHPANYGRLCSKGAALHETVDPDGRLLHPIVRGERTDWDSALDTVASAFHRPGRAPAAGTAGTGGTGSLRLRRPAPAPGYGIAAARLPAVPAGVPRQWPAAGPGLAQQRATRAGGLFRSTRRLPQLQSAGGCLAGQRRRCARSCLPICHALRRMMTSGPTAVGETNDSTAGTSRRLRPARSATAR